MTINQREANTLINAALPTLRVIDPSTNVSFGGNRTFMINYSRDFWTQAKAEHTSRRGKVDTTVAQNTQRDFERRHGNKLKRIFKRFAPETKTKVIAHNTRHHGSMGVLEIAD